MVLNPGDFYLLASWERISVPVTYAAEMVPFDPSIGEFSVHYAGFFDPGFGYGGSGEIKGTKAVLEVRAHEVPILLEDKQIVGRLIYHRMMDVPDKVYGQANPLFTDTITGFVNGDTLAIASVGPGREQTIVV